jgi:hypothetical protein
MVRGPAIDWFITLQGGPKHTEECIPQEGPTKMKRVEGPIRRTREGWSEWEPIKNLLKRDGNSNKMNSASNTRLRLTTHAGQAHVATGVPLDLGTNTQPSDPRTQWNTKPRVYRPTPVRPVPAGETGQFSLSGSTPVRPVRHTG